jgi:hypothetical protein
MYGIICEENLPGHSLFANFKLALKNYFQRNFTTVRNVHDLNGLEVLFIVDEHFGPHVDVWKTDNFIDTVNSLNIKVVIFNFEKVYSSQFPWNADHQNKVLKFRRLCQLLSDVQDVDKLNTKNFNKQLLSKDTTLVNTVTKNNKMVFIGQVNSWYPTRQSVINSFKSRGFDLDVIVTDRKLTYTEFLNKLNQYKFVLNPLGTGHFLNLRFYEALQLGCIPIQQFTEQMLPMYQQELNYCVSFKNPEEVTFDILNNFSFKKMDYYLENYFNDIHLNDKINNI